MNEFVALGFDGGGTRSRAVLVNPRGEIIGVGGAGPANIKSEGLDKANNALAEAVEQTWKECGLGQRPVDSAFLGCAGVGSREDRARFKQAAVDAGIAAEDKVWVDHDLRIALAGALGGAPGIVIVSGTGSAAYGRTAKGDCWQAGGWGWKIDDLGSGYWLGKQALRAAAREADGRGKPTSLTGAIIEQLGLNFIGALIENLYGRKPMGVQEIAELARIVIREAEKGDGVAVGIVAQGCSELARMALAVYRKLDWGNESVPVTISAIGGVAGCGSYFTSTLKTTLDDLLPGMVFNKPILPPVLGAAFLAIDKDKAGGETGREVLSNLSGHPATDGLW